MQPNRKLNVDEILRKHSARIKSQMKSPEISSGDIVNPIGSSRQKWHLSFQDMKDGVKV